VREENARTYFIANESGIYIRSFGKVGTRKLLKSLPRDLSAVEVFQRIAPEQAVPQALLTTENHFREQLQNRPLQQPPRELTTNPVELDLNDQLLAEARPSSGPGELRQAAVDDSACPAADFAAFACDNDPNRINYCRLHRTNTNTIREDDVGSAFAFACSYRGTITHRVRANTWSWKTVDELTLLKGWDSWIIATSSAIFDQDVESKIYNSDGDGFHHAATIWD
jgi:hypothetical protein